MEEQILKIIQSHFYKFDKTTDEESAAKEITSHLMEFIDWCVMNIVKNRYGRYSLIEGKECVLSLEEVYQYWLNNVKK